MIRFKGIRMAWIMGFSLFAMTSAPLMAGTQVELEGNLEHFKGETTWDDYEEAPTLKFTITDVEDYAGETEKFNLRLHHAEWYQGIQTTLCAENREGFEVSDVRIFASLEDEAEFEIDIPRDVTEDTKLSFTLPLPITSDADIDNLSVEIVPFEKGERTKFTEGQIVMLGNNNEEPLRWKVETAPTIGDQGTMGDFIIEETKTSSLGTRVATLNLILQNRNFCFDEPEYEDKESYSDNTRYELEQGQYTTFKGGFEEGEAKLIEAILSKDQKKWTFRFQGNVPNEPGIVVLHDLPLIKKQSIKEEKEIKVLVQGEQFSHNNEQVVVANYDGSLEASSEKEDEDKEPQEDGESQKEKEENSTEIPTQKDPHIIKFKVGEQHYTVDGKSYSMDAKTMILETGYTMVPVRYVAEALGVTTMTYNKGKLVFEFNSQKVEIDTKNQSVKIGNSLIPLQAPIQVIAGRTYAPIGELAKLLDIQKEWDSTSKTAIFYC